MEIELVLFDCFSRLLLVTFGSLFTLAWAIDNRTLMLNEFEIRNKIDSEIVKDNTYILDELHAKGVEAYLDNNWDNCIEYFTLTAKEHRAFVKATAKCRIRCRLESSDETPMFIKNIENLHFYETAVRNALCLLKCKKITFQNKYVSITPELDKLYLRKKPYEYLHLCYFQKKMYQKAASACFTALVADPNNDIMVNNMQFYLSLPEVESLKMENMEQKAFEPLYIQGVEAYNKGDFASAINFLEKSLKKWFKAVEECRAYCEAPFNQGWYPEFISSVANHFTFCLRCKNNCETTLNSVNGEYYEDLLAIHYNYLQFAYYKVSKLQKACEAVESYLLFLPNEETMLNNKQFYLKLLNENVDYFFPTKAAFMYANRKKYENKILKFIDTEFKKLDENANYEEEINYFPG